jgi:hypothetical protein
MPDHRYFQGLHQAIEAKEGIEIKTESENYAITTFQHFFRQYDDFTGFTGTAQTAEKEFRMIYAWLKFIYCRKYFSRLFDPYYAEHIIIQRLRETGLLNKHKTKHNNVSDSDCAK